MSFDVHFWVGSGSSPYPKYYPDLENLYRTGTDVADPDPLHSEEQPEVSCQWFVGKSFSRE